LTFDQLGPQREAVLNQIETRFKLPPDQVDLLIAAGRDALNTNDKFRAFLTSLGRVPGEPRAAPLLRPHRPGTPVSQSNGAPQEAQAQ
jgi:hypothetical protein